MVTLNFSFVQGSICAFLYPVPTGSKFVSVFLAQRVLCKEHLQHIYNTPHHIQGFETGSKIAFLILLKLAEV